MNANGIIPARYASSRFPGKPLADILGKPMIQWVYERSCRAKFLDEVIIATDDQRIFDAAKKFGGSVSMTSPHAANGTERIAEVAKNLSSTFVLNIQGDEPLIDPDSIDQLVGMMRENPQSPVGTLVKKIEKLDDLNNPNIPKVVIDKDFNALYFSRSIIPFHRDEKKHAFWFKNSVYYKHIGMYIYRREFLLEFVKLPVSNLEKIEQLEQLRVLENGYKIKVAETETDSIGVDVPEDINRVVEYLNGRAA